MKHYLNDKIIENDRYIVTIKDNVVYVKSKDGKIYKEFSNTEEMDIYWVDFDKNNDLVFATEHPNEKLYLVDYKFDGNELICIQRTNH